MQENVQYSKRKTDIWSRQSGKITGSINNIKNGSVLFKCPSQRRQCVTGQTWAPTWDSAIIHFPAFPTGACQNAFWEKGLLASIQRSARSGF